MKEKTGFTDMNNVEIYDGDVLVYEVPKKHPKQKPKFHYWEVFWYQRKGQWFVRLRGTEQQEPLWNKIEQKNHYLYEV